MTNVSVSYEEMEQSAGRMRAVRDDIDSLTKQLATMVEQLTSGGFRLPRATQSFVDTFDRWRGQAGSVSQGLQEMSSFLDKAVKDVQDLDAGLAGAAGN